MRASHRPAAAHSSRYAAWSALAGGHRSAAAGAAVVAAAVAYARAVVVR
jgi:hypothetical protein